MAEATRMQNAIREAEERIMMAVEPCITRQIRELENHFETQFTNVQEAMRGIGLQMEELTAARRHGGNGDGATRPAMRLTRLDFPKFTRDDVESWIAKCERFFVVGWNARRGQGLGCEYRS
ncbi:unnamed protein product [Vicia faba]|uniref:Uncharacterized protein n=1 Tax=Vicia faba TaxID=3906 RepID=A0AAV0ZAP5_VICFA|nr:unnamed protein product [Vicia faba]